MARDGGTEHSDWIGLYCGDKPGTIKSTGNVMYIKYYTTSNNPNIGFKAKLKIGASKIHYCIVYIYIYIYKVVALVEKMLITRARFD
jgi:hypothetical protein